MLFKLSAIPKIGKYLFKELKKHYQPRLADIYFVILLYEVVSLAVIGSTLSASRAITGLKKLDHTPHISQGFREHTFLLLLHKVGGTFESGNAQHSRGKP